MKIIIIDSSSGDKIRIFHHPMEIVYKPRSNILQTINEKDGNVLEIFLDVGRPIMKLQSNYDNDTSEILLIFTVDGGVSN